MNNPETRLRGHITKTFHGRKYRERVSAGEQLPHDCGFINVPGMAVDYFVNVSQVQHRAQERFVRHAQVEFTPVAGQVGPAAAKVVILS